jgi:hypothetical protein
VGRYTKGNANTIPAFETLDQDTFRNFNSGLGYNATLGSGDVCRYISAMGWVEGDWRLPTANEWKILGDETVAVPIGEKIGILPHDAGNSASTPPEDLEDTKYDSYDPYQQTTTTPTLYTHGVIPLPHARLLGSAVRKGDGQVTEYLTNPGDDRILLPAGGYRNSANGYLSLVGQYAYYASSTPSTNPGDIFYTWFHDSALTTVRSSGNGFGFSVRCIQNYNNQ